jgi:hypothetical protein
LFKRLTIAVCALAFCGVSAPAWAKKSKLTPAKVKALKKDRKSFEACRKDALSQLKSGSVTKKKFEVLLNGCKENFPGASLYISCKKAAIKTAATKNISPDEEVEQCKRYLLAASFDPNTPLPVFVDQGSIYFAGIGMNKPAPVQNLNPPNFDCEALANVARNPSSAQYFLFGNHPRMFTGLADLKGALLAKILKFTKPNPKGVDVQGFGRVFGDPKESSGVVFFPSAACNFDADLGDTFSGISSYYLLDGASSAVTPYFGIVYYKQDQKAVTTPKLVQGLLKELGSSFKSYSKNSQVTFVAAASVTETDDEEDPKNLCKQPRQHRFVAVVQGRKDAPNSPEYMLLANIKNLCDFGDRMAKRLTE